jgi:ribosomal protein S18 acetylase RimI-like enzyme
MKDIVIRKATIKDLPQILLFDKELAVKAQSYCDYNKLASGWAGILEKTYKKDFRSRKVLLWVAEKDSGLVGFVRVDRKKPSAIFRIKKTFHVDPIFVAKKFRRAGVGSALMAAVVA